LNVLLLKGDVGVELLEGSSRRIGSEGESIKALISEVIGGTFMGDAVLHPIVERRL
jgi:hypothetical protein